MHLREETGDVACTYSEDSVSLQAVNRANAEKNGFEAEIKINFLQDANS